jgi:branched-chain amino acid transport system permease protein
MGEQILILAFVVVVIGGVGSVRGALFGALAAGLVDTMTRAFLPMVLRQLMDGSNADALASGVSSISIYLLMALALLVRPRRLLTGAP